MRPGGPRVVLSLNGGSSSLKFAAHSVEGDSPRRLLRGSVEGLWSEDGHLRVGEGDASLGPEEGCDARTPRDAVAATLAALSQRAIESDAVGHRIVHGGPDHLDPARVDDRLLQALRGAVLFAPLHLPRELSLIEAVSALRPPLPQAVCFDTAFHARMPLVARRLALPTELWDGGVRRYGFHGLSYESIVDALGERRSGRVVVAHLGNGASAAAIRDGEPHDTTMGLTPCGGLVMGTRSGDLDPGVGVYLARSRGLDADALERLLNRESGLLALSETTSDMRKLLAARESDARASLAIDAFCYSARKWVGALAASLGGMDRLVFTGGIGENAAPVREEICRGLEHLGVELDQARNGSSAPVISADGAGVSVLVLPADEERMIARHTATLVFGEDRR